VVLCLTRKPIENKAQASREHTKRLLMHWLDLGALSDENQKLKEALYDDVTKLPTISLLLGKMKSLLQKNKQVGLLYVDVVRDSKIEKVFGWRVFDEIMYYVAKSLNELRGKELRKGDSVSAVVKNGNAFVLLLSPPRTKSEISDEDLFNVKKRIEKDLRETLKQFVDPALSKRFRCNIGCAIVEEEPQIKTERLVFNALETARENAELQKSEKKRQELELLREIIDKEEISTLFQPIIDLFSGKIIGYEALSRGPQGALENPVKLFKLAAEADLVWKLDRLCRNKALLNAKGIKKHADLLTINVDPRAVGDPEFRNIAESVFLTQSGLPVDRIVFEVSERAMVADMDLFQLALSYFRALGFLLAIDNTGTGYYTGLELIAKLKPNFVKIDPHLIHEIDKNEIKQELIVTISRFAATVSAIVTAEGIETQAELDTVRNLGIQAGQGFLFAPPGRPFPKANLPT
jgi:EAL domain-containing protein (putative c-di-GMP-specific phosphodiesterase class I)/GGDEF domain-containing protein